MLSRFFCSFDLFKACVIDYRKAYETKSKQGKKKDGKRIPNNSITSIYFFWGGGGGGDFYRGLP